MSPLFKARMGGFCWLMCFVTSIYPVMINGRLIVGGDPAATAANLLANETLFRLGSASLLVSTAFYIGATLFVYEVLRPVNRSLSLLAAFFSLVACAVGALSCVFDLVPFILLKGAPYLTTAFTVDQLQALALTFLKVRVQAHDIALVLFGLHCLGVGYLIFRSIFLPRAIGVLMLVAGACWLTFLLPPFAQSSGPLQYDTRSSWRGVASPVANRERRERPTPGRTGDQRGNAARSASLEHLVS